MAPLATRWIERLLAACEPPLTVGQYLALRAIAAEEVTGTDLARRAGVSGPAASQLVAGLVSLDLLERHPHPDDRRRHALRLSPRGEATLGAADAVLARELSTLLADLPGPEVDALARLLPRVGAALAGTAPPRRPAHPPPRPRHRH